MVEDDVQLISKVLSGDDEAFTALVRKHQKVFMHWLGERLVIFTSLKRLCKMSSCESTSTSQS